MRGVRQVAAGGAPGETAAATARGANAREAELLTEIRDELRAAAHALAGRP